MYGRYRYLSHSSKLHADLSAFHVVVNQPALNLETSEQVWPTRSAPVLLFGDDWARWLDLDADVTDLLGPESRDRFEIARCGNR